jgi:uncharacterized protein (DUF3820 family)
MEDKQIDTHNIILDFGKYKGERWTRVPLGYLTWCVNQMPPDAKAHKLAAAELKRRGSSAPATVSISGHAIDRASLKILPRWREDKKEGEGLHSWLVRICEEALSKQPGQTERIVYKGCTLIFAYGNEYPTLATIMHK